MIRRAAKQIEANVRNEFTGIRKDIGRHLEPDVTVDHARELLAQHAPALVVGRAQLLLDSLLNYLMEDAVDSLADAPTDVKNAFYAQDLRARLKGSFTLEPQTLQFSFDPRVMAGGVAAGGTLVAGGLIVALVLSGVVTRIIVGLATLVASASAFRIAHSAGTASARRALESDVTDYLAHSEEQVSQWLASVERSFVKAFDKFVATHIVQQGDAS
jgi:hypothetical protein